MKTEQGEVTSLPTGVATVVRAMKRLEAAVGYYELGMIHHALQCLSSLWELGDIGPLRVAQRILRDAILEGNADFEAVTKAVETASQWLTPGQRTALWHALYRCYRPVGNSARGNRSRR